MTLRTRSIWSGAMAIATAAVATTSPLAGATELAAVPIPGPCTYAHLNVQPKVVLSVPLRTLDASVTTDCQDFDYVSNTWDSWVGLVGGAAQGSVLYATVSGANGRGINAPPQVYDSKRLGVWTWTPEHTLAPLTLADLNTTRMDVRVGSVTYLAAHRSGTTVTVGTRSYRYWTSTHAFGTWGRATGLVEWRTPGTSTWHGLKNVVADNLGRYSYRYSVSSVREYRVRMYDQPFVWGASSGGTARA